MTKQTTKLALFLSTLAIILIVLLMMHFKGLALFSKANASELSYEDAISEIYDYIDSKDGFTVEQKNALDSIITNYLKECDYLTKQDLTNIFQLIDDKYNQNKSYIEAVRDQLQTQLSNTSSSDSKRFDELNSLINDLNNWLEKTDAKEDETRKSFREIIQELRGYSDERDDTMNDNLSNLITELSKSTDEEFNSMNDHFTKELKELREYTDSENESMNNYFSKENDNIRNEITDLSDTMKSNNDDLWAEIEKLHRRTTDVDGHNDSTVEFNFGYQNGCYGYYTAENEFKPF